MAEGLGAVVLSLATARQERNQKQWANEPGTLARAWEVYQGGGNLARVSGSTAASYRAAIKRALAELPPTPRALDVQAWAAKLVDVDGKAPATVNWFVRSIRAVVEGADLAEGESFEVMRKAFRAYRCIPEAPKEKRAAPRDAMVTLYSSGIFRNKAEMAFVGLMGFCALRVGEVMGLQAGDWNEHQSVLSVRRQRTSRTRKNKAPHIFKVPEPLADWLRWTVRHRSEIGPRGGKPGAHSALTLFPWGATYINGSKSTKGLIQRVREVVDLPNGVAWHSFRHLVGTTQAERPGANPFLLKGILGDASLTAALGYYNAARGQCETDAAPIMQDLMSQSLKQADLKLGTVPRRQAKTRCPTTIDPSKEEGSNNGFRLESKEMRT